MNRPARRYAAAYARTEYRVLLDPPLDLRVGIQDAAAEARLTEQVGPWRRWALVTACNPRSQRQSWLENRRCQLALHRLVRHHRIRYLPSVNRDPAGRWPDEPGLWLMNVGPHQALGLAQRFRQNAVLVGSRGQPPQLLWA